MQRFGTESIGKWFGSVLATMVLAAGCGGSRQHNVLPNDTSGPKTIKKKQTASIHNHYKAFFIIFFVILQFKIIQKDKYMDQSHKIIRR